MGLGEGMAEHQETWVPNPPFLETMLFPALGLRWGSPRTALGGRDLTGLL